jgi:nucleoside-diphosphate-sugar epimerase
VFDRADALVAMAQQILRGTSPNRSPIEIVVTVPAVTLRAGEADTIDPTDVAVLADGTCISPHAIRRLACDAGVVEMIEDDRGAPLTVGRKTRTIPGAMKRAMLRRDRQTCRFPGCTNRLFLEGHHIEHWANGGETGLRNLVSTCSLHHRYVHEHGYTVELDADGEVHFRDAAGRVVDAVPPPMQPARLGWPSIEARNAYLDITPATNECGWDGRRVNYGYAIDDLVLADGLA